MKSPPPLSDPMRCLRALRRLQLDYPQYGGFSCTVIAETADLGQLRVKVALARLKKTSRVESIHPPHGQGAHLYRLRHQEAIDIFLAKPPTYIADEDNSYE